MRNAQVFKALCEGNRLTILELLQGGEECACRILSTLHISQPTLSHHMRILVESGIVSARKEGKRTYYSISIEGVQSAKLLLDDLTALKSRL